MNNISTESLCYLQLALISLHYAFGGRPATQQGGEISFLHLFFHAIHLTQ